MQFRLICDGQVNNAPALTIRRLLARHAWRWADIPTQKRIRGSFFTIIVPQGCPAELLERAGIIPEGA